MKKSVNVDDCVTDFFRTIKALRFSSHIIGVKKHIQCSTWSKPHITTPTKKLNMI